MVLALLQQSASAQPGTFPTDLAWPLCGRLYQSNFNATLCPQERWGNTSFTDLPLSDTVAPRLRSAWASQPCDFHRGVDLHADWKAPVFAPSGGYLYKLENDTEGGKWAGPSPSA